MMVDSGDELILGRGDLHRISLQFVQKFIKE